MKPLSSDTHPDAESVQIALLKQAEVWQRLGLVNALVQAARQLSWQGFNECHPNEDLQTLRIRWLAILYGEGIAKQVADHLSIKA